jgi:hypothetical protein
MAVSGIYGTGRLKMSLKAEISRGTVENFLATRPELSHVKVRVRGNVLTLESADEDGTIYPHARLKKKSVHMWDLEMPTRRGWEPTFIEGTARELMEVLIEKFPWVLAGL